MIDAAKELKKLSKEQLKKIISDFNNKKNIQETLELIKKYVENYTNFFYIDQKVIRTDDFIKLIPFSHRPYGKLYTY